MKPESTSAPLASPCETLFELFSTAHGSASVGRMLKGVDIGRFVLLRQARVDLSPQALAAIDVSRSLAHPRFAKLLGAIRTEECHYVASEYVPGVSLFELTLALRKRSTTIGPAVAVRLICDTLKCAVSAQKSLRSTAGVDYVRCIFPDTVWIAEFGDVLLTEVGVAPHLVRAVEESADTAAAKDLMAAAVELFHLASGRLITAETTQKLGEYLPAPLADVLERAMGVKGKTPFATLEQFIAALSALPAEFRASDDQVCAEIARVAGPAMDLRRRKLALFERGAASQSEEEDSTKFYRTASPEKRGSNTTRPPPPDDPSSAAPPVAGASGLPVTALTASRVPSFSEALAPSDSQPPADESEEEQDFTKFYRTVPPEKRESDAARLSDPGEPGSAALAAMVASNRPIAALTASKVPSFSEALRPSNSRPPDSVEDVAPVAVAESGAESSTISQSSVPASPLDVAVASDEASDAAPAPQSDELSAVPAHATRSPWSNTAVAALALAAAGTLWYANSGWIRSLLWSLLRRFSSG